MAERVIIIGSGPAGWAAAIYAARASLEPLVIEGEMTQENWDLGRPPLGQLAITTEVENYPGFPTANLGEYLDRALTKERRSMMAPHKGHGVSGPELMELMRQQAINFGTRTLMEDVTEIDLSQRPFKMRTSGGGEYVAQSVIIATGARANYLGLESEKRFKNMGVSACAVCDGALPRFRDQPLVVVGGGDSAMEESDYLSKFGSKIYIIHRRDSFRASKIMADRAINNPKIDVKWNSVVDEVLGNDETGVTGVRIRGVDDESKTEELKVSGYFAAIGHTPNTEFLNGQLETTSKNYLKWTVPFRTNTSVEGVFAAGDVADDYYRQAITAAGSGCQAALDCERWLSLQGLH
ncbi:FAD-dependent oxidoreductase [Planctomicrobium piriforme]|uniref:Thioredoxin reductase (NADPH) n=1 Tax=Planctomicrobium piriforme TaxID=1576369 RepID=A0A1I3P647_9PLAN|nr:FAD-dependent oxidoreductase [Planctomicrobium piriforme]SFJ16830.1 thioredoxin reductase (NADPH) [Planctomicrobium piriforme]